MAFDKNTRNRLANFVGQIRDLLTREFTKQCQNLYGLDPETGTVSDISKLSQLNDVQFETSKILRSTLDHYLETAPSSDEKAVKESLQRIVREQAFTVLNRLSALKMAEARGLLIEAVSGGYQSKGFQLYKRLAGPALGETGDTYRHFLFSIFDELAVDLPMFDRFSPNGRLFPRESILLNILEEINHQDLKDLWSEDETIGWIYQYFNSQEERKAMRKASTEPRNSRELAVRNQFFTPRYVVEFLVDNSLGKFWCNQTGGQTSLKEKCSYLLIKHDEKKEKSSRIRDPRSIRLLDPACGSMHFGLYAFDLLLDIYEEAWDWEKDNGAESLDYSENNKEKRSPLTETYSDKEAYLKDVPRLIIENNLFGVEIDARATQIASLSLWLRAQRSWHEQGVSADKRPDINTNNIIAAVAPPVDQDLRKDFLEKLEEKDAKLFDKTLELLEGVPELGTLLKIEKEIPRLIGQIYGESGPMFSDEDIKRWDKAEERLRAALNKFVDEANTTFQGRLFVDDALQILQLIDITQLKYDIVVMNPPFGALSKGVKKYLKKRYPQSKKDLLTIFIERGLEMIKETGHVGAITSRTCFFLKTYEKWREEILLGIGSPEVLADLGHGVMDDAMVEAAAYILGKKQNSNKKTKFIRVLDDEDKKKGLVESLNQGKGVFEVNPDEFEKIPNKPLAYWCPPEIYNLFNDFKSTQKSGYNAQIGLSTKDDYRFLRLRWEVANPQNDNRWSLYAKGGKYSRYWSDIHLVVNYTDDNRELDAYLNHKYSYLNGNTSWIIHPESSYWQPGLTYTRRTSSPISVRVLPSGCVFSDMGRGIFHENNDEGKLLEYLALSNSMVYRYLVELCVAAGDSAARTYEGGIINSLPVPEKIEDVRPFVTRLVSIAKSYKSFEETSATFQVMPISPEKEAHKEEVVDLQEQIDKIIASAYDLSRDSIEEINDHLSESDHYLGWELRNFDDYYFRILSVAVGCVFGRWDKDVFSDCMPSFSNDSIFQSLPKYPPASNDKLSIGNFPSILVDDVKSDKDLTRNVIKVLSEVEDKLNCNLIEKIKNKLGIDHVRDALKADEFFSKHLKMYSKSRRKAPIYWPLSSESGYYTLWIYYPDLTNQTLYTAVNDFIEPKLKQVRDDLKYLRKKNDKSLASEEKELAYLSELEVELADFKQKMLDAAKNYFPNHIDGVEIVAAPLWSLFPNNSWQKRLRETWKDLKEGEHDWAQIAMNYWPNRVVNSCHEDRSLAITHGLEQELWKEVEIEKKGRGGKIKKEVEWRPKDLTDQELHKIADRFKK